MPSLSMSRGGRPARVSPVARFLPLSTLLACSGPEAKVDDLPTAAITSPTNFAVVAGGAPVLVEGFALDPAEASPGLTARWYVDDLEACAGTTPARDGAVACEFTAPSDRAVEVRLEVTDAAGQSSVASLALTATATPDTGENAAPTCAFTTEPGNSVVGEGIALAGVVGDPDGGVERLTVQWVSDRDGVLGASTPTSAGEVAMATDALGAGSQDVRMVVTDPSGATCVDTLAWTVLVPPTITLDLPLAGTVTLLGEAAQFAVEVSDADSSADELVVTWESDLDGVFYEGHASPSGTAAFQSTGLSAGTHALTATVTDPSGLQAVAVGAITIDGPPTAPTVSLSPAAPTTHDALLVSIDAPATDPDGDALTYVYAWTVDGRASAASASGTLPASATTAGEVWTVAVSATDGFATSPVGTASVTILSSSPVVTGVTVTPATAAVGQTLTCAATAEDADGTALAPTYAWSNGAAGSTLVLTSAQDPGDVVTCTATATTADGAVATGTSGAVVVNTSPTLAGVTVSPAIVQPGGTATCSASASDPDGGTPTLTYAWSNGASGAAIVVDASTTPGSRLTCTATATDADGGVATGSASTLVYAAPTVGAVTLSPDPLYTDGLLTASAAVSDADGDTVVVTFDWYVDGARVQSGEDDTLDGATAFDRDQAVYVVVTADDGTTTVEATSATVSVRDSAPTTPRLATLLGQEGVDLTCAVGTESTDADGDAITYTFDWTLDGSPYEGATADAMSSTVDGAAVADGQVWVCTVVADDGTLSSPAAEGTTVVGGDCTGWHVDGSDTISRIRVPYDSALNLTGTPFTLEEWVYFDSLTPPVGAAAGFDGDLANHLAGHIDWGHDSADADGWLWKVYPDGRMTFEYGGEAYWGTFLTSASGSVSAGVWTHLAVTFDGGTYRLWVDGVRVASAAGPGPTWSGQTDPVTIGSFGDPSYYFAAQFSVAAARFSTTVRYSGTFSPEVTWPVDGDTLAQWDFGASGGSDVEADLSGNGHDADGHDATLVEEGPSCR